MKVKNLAKKFLCIASAVAMAVALMAEPIQVQAAGEVYTSELTGLPISASLKDQRPIAVMVDNETVSYTHLFTGGNNTGSHRRSHRGSHRGRND